MAVTPDTTISILKVPIEIDNLNQLTFANATAQYNYFNSCQKITEDDLYYQRKDNYISWPDHIDNIIEYNYVMYQNTNYSNKWFYAFITRMEYENDGMTRIYIETDVFQTWQFDIIYKASFVEREHVNDDTIGKHRIPENLNVNNIEQISVTTDTNIESYVLILETDWFFNENSTWGTALNPNGTQFSGTTMIGGNISGHQYMIFDPRS